MLSKGMRWAFQVLKQALSRALVLQVTDPRPMLQTRVIFSQLFAGDEHPVAYASQKLLPCEKHYATSEKGIVWALKIFHVYLYGQDFTLQMDHQSLAWLHCMKNSNTGVTQWALMIQPPSVIVLKFRMLMPHVRPTLPAVIIKTGPRQSS